MSDIVLDPKNPDHIFIAAFWRKAEADPDVIALYKSSNGGQSWTIHRPTNKTSFGQAVACVPGDSNIVYIGGRKGNDAVVYKTQDGGNNWESIGKSKFSKDEDILDIAVDPELTNIVYVATSGGLYRSKDSGNVWEKIYSSSVDCIRFNTKNTEQIFIAGYWGVQTSKNRGDTWEDLSEGLIVKDIRCLCINPKSKWVFAGSNGGGIYKKKY